MFPRRWVAKRVQGERGTATAHTHVRARARNIRVRTYAHLPETPFAFLPNLPQGKKNILAYAPRTRLAGYNSMEVSVLGDHYYPYKHAEAPMPHYEFFCHACKKNILKGADA